MSLGIHLHIFESEQTISKEGQAAGIGWERHPNQKSAVVCMPMVTKTKSPLAGSTNTSLRMEEPTREVSLKA